MTVKGRYTYFHADTLNHSNPTLAAGVAIAKVAGIVGSMVAAIFGGVGVIPSAVAVPAAAIPAAASVIPISKP